MSTTITLGEGRTFPVFEGKPLSWSIGLQFTQRDESEGFPRTRAVIRAMLEHRPEQLDRERLELVRGSCDRMFGHSARKLLSVIENECGELGE